MYHEHLLELTEFIKEHNPYFANGFAGAWQDADTGQVWVDANGRRAIFPEDQLGSMFYIRVGDIVFADHEAYPTLNCVSTGVEAVLTCILVATVRDADSIKLAARLTNTLALFSAAAVKLTSARVGREDVVLAELSKADDAARKSALQRLRNQAIVSITFTFRTPVGFVALDCLPAICPEC